MTGRFVSARAFRVISFGPRSGLQTHLCFSRLAQQTESHLNREQKIDFSQQNNIKLSNVCATIQ